MGTPYLGEIRTFSFGFAPKGWAMCNGQLLPINQNQALFSLLGTFYGGNGTTNFALPNAQGRVLAHPGNGFVQGELTGEASHTLTIAEMPTHSHEMLAGAGGNQTTPAANGFGIPAVNARVGTMYSTTGGGTASPQMVANTGGSQSHYNLQPYLVVNVC